MQKNILDLTSFALLINESVCVDSEWLYNIIVFIKSESKRERVKTEIINSIITMSCSYASLSLK